MDMATDGATKSSRFPWMLAGGVLIIIVALLVGIWFVFFTHKTEPYAVRFIENGHEEWYWYHKGNIQPMAEDDLARLPAPIPVENGFASVLAENGSVVALSPEGLIVISATGERNVLIARTDLEPGSSTISTDAGASVLFNTTTNAYDLFALDRTRPAVLSYLGSIPAPETMYSLGFAHDSLLLVRTSETEFLWYEFSNEGVRASGPAKLKSADSMLGALSAPVAHAWTYSAQPTATGATTASGQRCTGAQVATLGTASGSGTMPSVQTTVWSYMPSPGNLPANYNNGTYCIQAYTTITTTGGDPGDTNPRGGGNEVFESDAYNTLASLFANVAYAQTTTWTITYTAHSGTGTTAGTDYYALTYSATPSVSLTASPNPLNSGSNGALTLTTSNVTSCTPTGFSTGAVVNGTFTISPVTTTTYSVTCTGPGGSASDSEQVTVVTLPNLTSSTVIIPSPTQGTPVTLSATVSNTGTASTGTGFSTLFQIASNSSGTDAQDIGTHTQSTAVANGSTFSATLSYGFPSAGTWYVRACADKTTGGSAGVITESNESDNCGSWTSTTVTGAVGGTVSALLSAAPDTIEPGESTTLSYSCTNALSALIDNGVGELSPVSSGTRTVSPLETTTYFLSCFSTTDGASGGGDGINVPFAIDEWWTGGTSETVFSEWMHNNDFSLFSSGYGVEELCASYAGGYDAWNLQVRDTERVGDAGTSLMWLTCYGVNNPTGTVAKPQETHYLPPSQGSNPEYTTYARSMNSTGGEASDYAVSSVTITVETVTECNDGEDNDRDGKIDLNDEGCPDGDDDSETGEVNATLDANPTQVPVGTASTLEWECAGGATSASISGIGSVSPASGGTISTGNLSQPSNNFELTCTSPTDTDTDIAVVTTTNPTGDIEAQDDRVLQGGSTFLDWSCYPEALSGSVSSTNDFTASTVSGTDVPSMQINSQTVFTLYCDGVEVDSDIVNVAVNIEEF